MSLFVCQIMFRGIKSKYHETHFFVLLPRVGSSRSWCTRAISPVLKAGLGSWTEKLISLDQFCFPSSEMWWQLNHPLTTKQQLLKKTMQLSLQNCSKQNQSMRNVKEINNIWTTLWNQIKTTKLVNPSANNWPCCPTVPSLLTRQQTAIPVHTDCTTPRPIHHRHHHHSHLQNLYNYDTLLSLLWF